MTYAPGKNACQRKVKERKKERGFEREGSIFKRLLACGVRTGAEERRAGENGRLCARGPLGRGTVAKA